MRITSKSEAEQEAKRRLKVWLEVSGHTIHGSSLFEIQSLIVQAVNLGRQSVLFEIQTRQAQEAGSLRYEIEQAINRCSAENVSDTPDYILAEYLIDCLQAFDKAVNARTVWQMDDEPTGVLAVGDLTDLGMLGDFGEGGENNEKTNS